MNRIASAGARRTVLARVLFHSFPAPRSLAFSPLVALVLAAHVLAAPGGDPGRVRWSVFDEGQGWIPDSVALGDHGSTVFAGSSNAHVGLRLFAAGSPEPLLVTTPTGGDVVVSKSALAAAAPFAVSLCVQDHGPSASPRLFAVVRAYDLEGDAQPLWERTLPGSDFLTPAGVLASDHGEIALAWWSVESLGGLLVTAFDAQGKVRSRHVIAGGGIVVPDEVALSHDGRRALFSLPGIGHAVVYDVLAGREIAALPDNGIFSAHAMSGDGERFAAVSYDAAVGFRVRVFELDANGVPVAIFEELQPSSVRVAQAALDLDGSRFAYAVQQTNPEDAFRVVLRDLDAGTLRFTRVVEAPDTDLQLWCSGLALDDAGETLACASWGDSDQLTPEVLVLDGSGNTLIGLHARGSALALSLSRDGELLFAGCKATHAGVFGAGGDLYLVETRAQSLRLEGAPRLGEELALSIRADARFDRALLVASPALLDEPLGDLRLDFGAGRRVLGAFALAQGELDARWRAPAASALAGTDAHVQAVLFDGATGERALTNKVSLHWLP